MNKPIRVIKEFNEELGKWVYKPQIKDRLVYSSGYGDDEFHWRGVDTWFTSLDEAIKYCESYKSAKDGEVVYEN